MSATPIMMPAPEDDFAELLSKIAPFQDLPDAVRSNLCENSDKRHYDAGQTVFSMGQYDGSEFFVILSGQLRVSLVDSETGAMVIEEFSENEIFGLELVLIENSGDSCQQLSVTAENDLDLIAVDGAAFRNLAAQRPSLMRNIAMYFATELAALRFKTMTAQAAPEQRVFAALLEFVKRDSVTGEWRVQHMPKHRELADKAGVEEAETASAVASLIQEGVAQRDYPGLVINDMSRLNQLAS